MMADFPGERGVQELLVHLDLKEMPPVALRTFNPDLDSLLHARFPWTALPTDCVVFRPSCRIPATNSPSAPKVCTEGAGGNPSQFFFFSSASTTSASMTSPSAFGLPRPSPAVEVLPGAAPASEAG